VDTLEDTYERMLEETYQRYRVVQEEINKAERDGRAVAHVITDQGTKRGDIISISRYSADGTVDEDAEEFKARVLATVPRTALDEAQNTVQCVEALCVVLQPGDVESLDDFAAMYGDEDEDEDDEQQEEPLEAEDRASEELSAEPEDPNACPCGADRHMCEKNQKVFGGHLND